MPDLEPQRPTKGAPRRGPQRLPHQPRVDRTTVIRQIRNSVLKGADGRKGDTARAVGLTRASLLARISGQIEAC